MKIEEKSKYKFIVHDIKLLPINKGNTTYQSNKLCRKTCKHNKQKQSNYKICKEIDNSEPWMNKVADYSMQPWALTMGRRYASW